MEIIKGKVKKPFNVILYGVPGIGKSTWAAGAPEPLFIGAEENDELNASRLKRAETWTEFIEQLAWLDKTSPEYSTLVVDTLDSVEKLLHRHILAEDSKSSGSMARAHGGYGRAFEQAESEMIKLRSKLQSFRDKGKGIVLLAHSNKTKADDTNIGLQYDTYEMAIHRKAQAVFVDWVSAVLFANYVVHRADDDNSDKVFAIGQGERMVLTEKRPGFLAKNRYNLPYEMPLEFEAFHERYLQFYEMDSPSFSPDEVYQQCVGLLSNISDAELQKKIVATMDKALEEKNQKKMMAIKKRIEERINT